MKYIIIYVLIILATCSACTQADSVTDDHAHSTTDIKLQLTEYTNDFELFAEFDPFVKGEAVSILAHFTKLADFKPLTEGQITLSLIVGTKG